MLLVMATEPNDKTLMLRYRDGDVAAFELLYSRHRGPLFRYFLRSVADRDIAAELFQEVWTNIIRARNRYEPRAKFTTYMYQLAHNVRVDYYRRQSRRPQTDACGDPANPEMVPAASTNNPENITANAEAIQRFRAALNELPADQRDAFLLREEAGLSLAEIAAVTGVTAETAKSRLRYAVSKLRQSMRGNGDGM